MKKVILAATLASVLALGGQAIADEVKQTPLMTQPDLQEGQEWIFEGQLSIGPGLNSLGMIVPNLYVINFGPAYKSLLKDPDDVINYGKPLDENKIAAYHDAIQKLRLVKGIDKMRIESYQIYIVNAPLYMWRTILPEVKKVLRENFNPETM